jgi:multiple sugar transport system substrate-binding protein
VAAITPLLLLTGACGAASGDGSGGGGESGKLVVWDWKSGEPASKAYIEAAKADFAKKHPDVQVEFVSQPFDNYYTLIGNAIEAGAGPDLMMFNGGAQLRDRTDALVPLDDALAGSKDRLTGWEAFQAEGKTYAAPVTLQGHPFYYNKAVYKEAGLDPEAPPATFEELEKACGALAEKDKDCFSLGNKEGIGIEFFLSGFGPGAFSAEQYDAWLAGDRDWSAPEVKQIFDLWVKTNKDGWYNDGVNSTAMFMDQFTKFQGGDAGNVIGLISDVGHWKSLDEFLGDDLGVYAPPVVNDSGSSFLPVEGGIGYGVTKWTKDRGLATDLVESLTSTGALTSFYKDAGAIVSDTTVDTADAGIPAVDDIVSWLPKGKPPLHTALSADTLDLMHRLSQQLISGDVTVDKAVKQLAESDK